MIKKGIAVVVILLFVGLALAPSINAVNNNPAPDLECWGEVNFIEVEPEGTAVCTLTVENVGDPESLLNWEIQSYPEWGTWTFDPEYGFDLFAGNSATIDLEFVAPLERGEYFGQIVIINTDNPDDFCIIDCSLDNFAVSIVKSIKQTFSRIISSYNNIGNVLFDPVPDLDCYGDLAFGFPPAGETVIGTITVENIGELDSLLNWEIVSWPEGGIWSFDPDSGTDLHAGDTMTICIEVLITGGEMIGTVLIVNSDNPDDFCEVDLTISGFPPPPRKIIGFIDSLNISEYFISFHIKLALGIFESYGFPPWPIVRIQFNKDFFNSKYYEGDIDDNFVNAIFYY